MSELAGLIADFDRLIEQVKAESAEDLDSWTKWDIRPEFRDSARNLAAYLAFRQHDLREMQRSLMRLGLSSLGRLESRVLVTLETVRAALAALAGHGWARTATEEEFFAGERQLDTRAHRLFGEKRHDHQVAMLVTCPSEAADDPGFMHGLAERGVEAIRINCAHDDAPTWERMIASARAAEAEFGYRMQVFMDLGGPKLRTGKVSLKRDAERVFAGERVAMVAPGLTDKPLPADVAVAFECTLPEVLAKLKIGDRMLIDEGKIATTVEAVHDGTVIASVTRAKAKGAKLKSQKGINLPDSDLRLAALTDKDRQDLAFVAEHADAIEFSFVQSPDDVVELQDALCKLRPADWTEIPLVLKIETAQAVRNLPEIIVSAGARQPVAAMIARGDLAIEIGFARLAEMQEEMLWIAEAAQVPVIWATQVLEDFVKNGLPTRGELTDAAMATRAECVMLNKGPYLFEAIDALRGLLIRMQAHIYKKTPMLRRLKSW